MVYEPQWITDILEKEEKMKSGAMELRANMKPHDVELWQKWTSNEKDEIRKLLLNFGYDRWDRLMSESEYTNGALREKPLLEIQAFANSFLGA